jgi:hypothetical protein
VMNRSYGIAEHTPRRIGFGGLTAVRRQNFTLGFSDIVDLVG